MKKLIKIFALAITFLIPNFVFAESYIPGTLISLGPNETNIYYSSTSDDGPSELYRGKTSNYYVYHYPSYTYKVQLNGGESYPAICVDPGLSAPSNKSLKCVAIKNNKVEKLLKDNQDTAGTLNDYHASLEIAIRALSKKWSSSWEEGKALIPIYNYLTENAAGKTGKHLTLSSTLFEIDGSSWKGKDTYKNANSSHTSGDVLDKAVDYYNSVADIAEGDSSDSSGTSSDSTSATITVDPDYEKNDNVYTYTVRSNKEIKGVETACLSNCSVVSTSWTDGAKEGTVKIKYNGSPDCKFKFQILYNLNTQNNLTTSHLYLCSYGDDITSSTNSYQKYAVYMDEAKQVEDKYDFTYTATPDECICSTDAEVKKSISQCCDIEQTSYVYEPEIKDLFCEEKTDSIDVDGFKVSSKAEEKYKVDNSVSGISLSNSYCSLYCTERITIDLPKTVTANSGKYFDMKNDLHSDSDGPYFTGRKTCRLRIDYSSWYSDYKDKTVSAKNAFNNYQKAQAKKDMYTKVYNNKLASLNSKSNTASVTRTVSFSGTTSTSCTKDSDGSTVTISNISVSGSATPSCDFKYRNYISKSDYPTTKYEQVKITYNGSDDIKGFAGLTISTDSDGTFGDDDKIEGYYDIDGWVSDTCGYTSSSTISSCSGSYTDCNGVSQTISGVTCGYSGISGDLPSDIKSSFDAEKNSSSAASQSTKYTNAVTNINKLESYLNECDNYFDEDGKGTERDSSKENNPYKVYNMDPSVEFNYFTVNINNTSGDIEPQKYNLNFSTSCTYSFNKVGETASEEASSIGLEGYHYNKYNTNRNSSIKNFNNPTISCLNNLCNGSYNSSIINDSGLLDNSSVTYSQRYTEDAYYTATCTSKYDDTGSFVVYPFGDFKVDKTISDTHNWTEYVAEGNFLRYHSTRYYTEYSSVEGTYETYWNLSELGSDGRFDTYFENNQTCSDSKNTSTEARLYCKMRVEHEFTHPGGCDSSVVLSLNDDSPGYWDENCEHYPTGESRLFAFKIVDPNEMFTDSDWQDKYAYNWTQKLDVKNAIESVAAADQVYSSDRLTYAFVLTASDLTLIKEYNSSTSYSDFNMTCDGVTDDDDNLLYYKDCQSKFITNYYDGKICTSSSCKNIKQKIDSNYPTLSSVRSSSSYRHVEG